MKQEYVWYVCYGSNLSQEKFIERYINICTDKTPPVEARPYILHHPLYFAGKSGQWGGGVAFIGSRRDEDIITFGRAYKITSQQLREIRIKEGPGPNWYGNRLQLGVMDELPVFTLTRDPMYDFSEVRPAPAEYIRVIEQGLTQTYPGLNAQGYIEKVIRYSRSLIHRSPAL